MINSKQLTTNNKQQTTDPKIGCRLKRGQAMLVAVIVIFVAVIAIGVAAASIALSQTQIIQNQKLSNEAFNLATSGIENTLMRMTKGDFTNPEPLLDGVTSCTISISGGPNYIILATSESISPLTG